MTGVTKLERENLTVLLGGHDPVVLELIGSLREAYPRAWLQPLLRELAEDARRRGATSVCLDWSRLSYMNATAFREFVAWLSEFLEDQPSRRVILVTNPKEMWQSMFVSTLRMVIGGDRLNVRFA